MEKLGMSHEGRLRQTQRYKGRWWDTLVYGMLEDEWRMDRGERLVTPHKNSSPNKRLQAETST